MVSLVPHSSYLPAFDNMVSSLSLLLLILLGHSVLLCFWAVGGRFAAGAFTAQNSSCSSALVLFLFLCLHLLFVI